MLFFILTVVAIAAGFVLWELIDEIYLPICFFSWYFYTYSWSKGFHVPLLL